MWDSIVSGISNIGKAIGGLFGGGGASNGVSSATANALENQMTQNGGKLFTSYISNPVGVDNAVLNTVTNMPSATIGLTGGMAGLGATNIPNGNNFGSNITSGILGNETGSHSFGLKDIANIAATGYDLYNKYKTDKINRENAQYDLDWKKSENNRLKERRKDITNSYQNGKVF